MSTIINECRRRLTSTFRLWNRLVHSNDSEMAKSPKESIYMLVGLGNWSMPNTRHNIGMTLIDFICKKYNIEMKMNKKLSCSVGTMLHPENSNIEIILVKPKSFMNNCGSKILKCSNFYQVYDYNIYLIHDELDILVGKYKLKENGSPRGHNGVKSVHEMLNNQNPPRLLIGIDRPSSRNQVADYVLNSFDDNQSIKIQEILPLAADDLLNHIFKKHKNNQNNKS